MKRKLLSIGIIVLCLFSIVACGDNTESKMENESEKKQEDIQAEESTDTTNEDSRRIMVGDTITFEKFKVTVNALSIVKDYDGKDVLKVVYTYENISDESQSPFMQVSFKGFQNGVEMEDAFMVDSIDLGIAQKEIRSGTVLENCQDGIILTDMSEIELEIEDSFSFSDNPYILTINPSEL